MGWPLKITLALETNHFLRYISLQYRKTISLFPKFVVKRDVTFSAKNMVSRKRERLFQDYVQIQCPITTLIIMIHSRVFFIKSDLPTDGVYIITSWCKIEP